MTVYFARQPETGLIKIGTTANKVTARMKTLGMELLAVIPGSLDEEQAMHARFAAWRQGVTERFEPAPELLSFIASLPPLPKMRTDGVIAADAGSNGPRAMAAYFRSGANIQPASTVMQYTVHGKDYVVLENANGILAVYRVKPDGFLKALRRWPSIINQIVSGEAK
jgi:hypothetical protein